MIQFTRFAIGVSIVAGSFSVAAAAHADIPITGGQVSGDAAFFTQLNAGNANTLNRTGSPVLFDTVIQTLRIVTPNGTTTTSRFLPNASRFTDSNGNSRPDSGDQGRLEGALSGVAFSRVGSPVFFQNIPTALNFTLTAFTPNSFGTGSLISPNQTGTAPLVFIPGVNVQLSSASSSVYSSKPGLLEVGPFAANLTGDFIGLPSDLQLRPAATEVTLVPVFLGRRIKFDFEGKNAQVDEAAYGVDPATGRRILDFAGAVTDFKIQSVGTPGSSEFKIDGSGTLDISLTGPFDIKKDSLNLNTLTGQVDYRIKGEGPGFVAFTGGNSITYSGTSRRDTDFKFEQGNRSFEGKSGGDTFFTVSDRRDNINFTRFVVIPVVGVTTTAGAAVITPSTTGSASSTTTVSASTSTTVFSTTVFNSSSITIFPGYRNLLTVTRGENDDDDGDARNYGRNTSYYVYQQRGTVEVVVERRGDRILLVDRTEVRGRKLNKKGKVVGAYQVVGLPSRVFPGMTGLRQIPADTVQSSSTEPEPTAQSAAAESTENTATPMPAVEPAATSTSSGTAIAP
ncbi:MAG: hypothetical protein DCF22_02295 [Leptolyngbya sp.]|nr:MAG: hypothetical protein DCF22_02295 [Leptolyngbya sp.]